MIFIIIVPNKLLLGSVCVQGPEVDGEGRQKAMVLSFTICLRSSWQTGYLLVTQMELGTAC